MNLQDVIAWVNKVKADVATKNIAAILVDLQSFLSALGPFIGPKGKVAATQEDCTSLDAAVAELKASGHQHAAVMAATSTGFGPTDIMAIISLVQEAVSLWKKLRGG